MVDTVAQCQIDDVVVEESVVVQDELFYQVEQRGVGIDLPAQPAKDSEVLYGLFERVRVVANVKGTKLMQKRRLRGGDRLTF